MEVTLLPVDDERWMKRMEDDTAGLRRDLASGLERVNDRLEALSNQFTQLQLTLPRLYPTSDEVDRRIRVVSEDFDRRDKENVKGIEENKASNRWVLGIVVGALITGVMSLVNEVFHLLGHTP